MTRTSLLVVHAVSPEVAFFRELYDPFDPELVTGRERARHLGQALNAACESEQQERRRMCHVRIGGDTLIGPAVQVYTTSVQTCGSVETP